MKPKEWTICVKSFNFGDIGSFKVNECDLENGIGDYVLDYYLEFMEANDYAGYEIIEEDEQ